MNFKKFIRLALGLALAAVFIWLTFRQINFHDLKQTFSKTTPLWVLAGLLAFFIGYACRIERWRQMLTSDNAQIKWQDCAGPFLASFAGNNVLPFRAGDVLRIFAFNRRLNVSSGVVVATLFVERLLDLLMVLLLLSTALFMFDLAASDFVGVGSAALAVVAVAILLVLFCPHFFSPVIEVFGTLIARLAPRLGQTFLAETSKSLATLQHLSKGGTMLKLVLWSLAAWLAEGCVFWSAALALTTLAIPLAAWLALPVGTLATLIPSTPGYVGTFDFFTARAMSVLGNTPLASTAYALLVHALLWFPPTLAGGVYLLLHPAPTQQNP